MNTINLRTHRGIESNILFPYAPINTDIMNSDRLRITHGEGIWLHTEDGNSYMDAISGLWNTPLGYSNKEITTSISEQLARMSSCALFDYTYPQIEENASRLLGLCDHNFSKVSYTCSGSEAVELAIKLARKACKNLGAMQKATILALDHSYHGTTYGALSISFSEEKYFFEYGPGMNSVMKIPAYFENSEGNWHETLEWISDHSDSIAAVVIEPILLSYGIQDLSHEYIRNLSCLCKEKQIFLIFDEVATGFFRSGYPFCYQKYGVCPDILCLSKAINAGYLPLGAVCISPNVVDILNDCINEDFLHGSTQSGNPLAIAASNAALTQYRILFSDEHILTSIQRFVKKIDTVLRGSKTVKSVVQNGLLILIETICDCPGTELMMNNELRKLLRCHGLLVYPAQTGLLLLPMYITSDEEYDYIALILLTFFGK